MVSIVAHLSKQQVGLRKITGAIDDIFMVRHTLENALEHQVPLHCNCVDVNAAVDTICKSY